MAGSVEVRLPTAEGDDAATVRINLRLPANLKALIEDAAAGGGISVNAWIVRAAAAGLAVVAVPNSAFPASEEALGLAAAVIRSLDELTPELIEQAAGTS